MKARANVARAPLISSIEPSVPHALLEAVPLRCARCDVALPEGAERCPKCLRTSTVRDTTKVARPLERDDEPRPPSRNVWWMPVLIVVVQVGLGMAIYAAKQASNADPFGHSELTAARWVIVPYFLAVTYGVRAVTHDWAAGLAAIMVALLGPLVLEGTAVGVTMWLVDSASGLTLAFAAAAGLVLSIALGALWAHLTLRAYAKGEAA